MKKLIAIISFICLIFCLSKANEIDTAYSIDYNFLGDINNDGYISISDVLILKNYLLTSDSNINSKNADINQDGTINILDVSRIINKIIYSDPSELESPSISNPYYGLDSEKFITSITSGKYRISLYNPEDKNISYITQYIDKSNDINYIFTSDKTLEVGLFKMNNEYYIHSDDIFTLSSEQSPFNGILDDWINSDIKYTRSGSKYKINENTFKYDEFYCSEDDIYIKIIMDNANEVIAIEQDGDILNICGFDSEFDSNKLINKINNSNLVSEDEFGTIIAENAAKEVLPFIPALSNIYSSHTLPNNELLSFSSNNNSPLNNKYSICDIDFDGSAELIYSHTADFTNKQFEYIFKYNKSTNEITLQSKLLPNPTYYSNGIVIEYNNTISNNNNTNKSFSIMKYNSSKDCYDKICSVDVWNKNSNEQRLNEKGELITFPDDKDTDNTGFLYFINDVNYNPKTPVTYSEYNKWLNSYLENSEIINIPYINGSENDDGYLPWKLMVASYLIPLKHNIIPPFMQ